MMWPPQRVKTQETPSARSARATIRPPCIDMGTSLVSGAELDVLDVRHLLAEIVREPLLHARLDLPDALAADAELVPDLLQRDRLLVVHEGLEPPLVDGQVLAFERPPELGGRAPDELMVLLIRDGVGSLLVGRQEIKEGSLLALGERCVDRDVARREPLLHLDDFLLLHVQALRDELRRWREAFALEPVALLLEIEEELALRLRGADLHQPPVVDDVPDDVGADPPDRVGRKADSAVGVEVLDRLEEPDVPLLDQVEEIVEGALVLARDHHDQAQVRRDELPSRLALALLVPAERQLVLLLAREDGDAADLGEVALEGVDRDERRGRLGGRRGLLVLRDGGALGRRGSDRRRGRGVTAIPW